MRRMRFARCSGASATAAMMATQFGLAMRPRCAVERVRVHFGHDERHVGLHAEGRGVVDHDGAARGRRARDAARDAAAGREEREVDAVQAVNGELLHRERAAAEMHRAPGGAARGEQAERSEREAALLEAVDELGADRAGGADDRDLGRGRDAAWRGEGCGVGVLVGGGGGDLVQAHVSLLCRGGDECLEAGPRRSPAGPRGCLLRAHRSARTQGARTGVLTCAIRFVVGCSMATIISRCGVLTNESGAAPRKRGLFWTQHVDAAPGAAAVFAAGARSPSFRTFRTAARYPSPAAPSAGSGDR